jgi:hypothetical protein
VSEQRHRGLTEQTADAAVDTACRVLRLPTIRGQYSATADAAEREQMTYRGFLAELLMAEREDRDRRGQSGASSPPDSPARSSCGISTSTPTPMSHRLPSIPSPPASGSAKASHCA